MTDVEDAAIARGSGGKNVVGTECCACVWTASVCARPSMASYRLRKDVTTGGGGKGAVGSHYVFPHNCVLFYNYFKIKSLIKIV